MNADNGHSAKAAVVGGPTPDARRLYFIEEATVWDVQLGLEKQECSNVMCEEPAAYFRWTGTRWWKLCGWHLVPHLRRQGRA